MIRALLFAASCIVPSVCAAQSSSPDLSPLLDIDTSVFIGGECAPVNALADFMLVIECGDSNPVISFIAGMAPQYAEDFALSDDIQARCGETHGCITADSLVIGAWTGGRDLHEGNFGPVSHTVLVSGAMDLEITSRALDEGTAAHNAEIALELLRDLVLCPASDVAIPNCPDQ